MYRPHTETDTRRLFGLLCQDERRRHVSYRVFGKQGVIEAFCVHAEVGGTSARLERREKVHHVFVEHAFATFAASQVGADGVERHHHDQPVVLSLHT